LGVTFFSSLSSILRGRYSSPPGPRLSVVWFRTVGNAFRVDLVGAGLCGQDTEAWYCVEEGCGPEIGTFSEWKIMVRTDYANVEMSLSLTDIVQE
jgi:hypothetical protein